MLMVVVVFFHSIVFWRGGWFDIIKPSQGFWPYKLLAKWLQSFHVYGFALVSGYLFYYVKYERGGYKSLSDFIKKKVRRLLVPYFFVSIVWAIPIGIYFFHYGIQDVIRDYVFGKSPNQLWFLLMLFWALLFLLLVSDIIKKNVVTAIIAAVLFYSLSIVVGRRGGGYLQISAGCAYMPLLICGFLIKQYHPRLPQKMPTAMWLVSDMILLYASMALESKSGAFYIIISFAVTLALHIWGALMAFYVLQRLARVIKWQENAIFRFLSKHSMAIYMFHQQVIYFVLYYLNERILPLWLGLLAFAVSITISAVIASLLLKYRITRFLIGGK